MAVDYNELTSLSGSRYFGGLKEKADKSKTITGNLVETDDGNKSESINGILDRVSRASDNFITNVDDWKKTMEELEKKANGEKI